MENNNEQVTNTEINTTEVPVQENTPENTAEVPVENDTVNSKTPSIAPAEEMTENQQEGANTLSNKDEVTDKQYKSNLRYIIFIFILLLAFVIFLKFFVK